VRENEIAKYGGRGGIKLISRASSMLEHVESASMTE